MKSKIFFSSLIVLCFCNVTDTVAQSKSKPNVLFIAIDDLKPILLTISASVSLLAPNAS